MSKRHKKSGIIDISSGIQLWKGVPEAGVYSGTKAFSTFLTKGNSRDLDSRNVEQLSV